MRSNRRLIAPIAQFIFNSSWWRVCAMMFGCMILKVGVWFIPNFGGYASISANPFSNPFDQPDAHYLFWSWLGPWLAWLLHARSFTSFLVLHGVFALLFSLLYFYCIKRRLSNENARKALLLFFLLPASATVYFWISMDGLTLLLMMVAMGFPERRWVTILAGICLGMQHFEQGAVAVAALCLANGLNPYFALKSVYRFSFSLRWLLSIALGKLVLFAIFYHYNIHLNSGRWYYFTQHTTYFPKLCFFHGYEVLWSVLGLGWLIALKYIDGTKHTWPFFMGLVLTASMALFIGDHARVFAVVTFPLVMAYWLCNVNFLATISRQEISWFFLIWLVMPWYWLWGSVRGSVFFYDLALVLHHTLGWFLLPDKQALATWPFA